MSTVAKFEGSLNGSLNFMRENKSENRAQV